MTAGIVDPLGQIVRECADPAINRRSVAMTYAFALRQKVVGYGPANRAIIERFGEKGLQWIKRRAWAYCDGTVKMGSRKDTP